MIRRILITLALMAIPFVVGLLATYEGIKVDFTSFMEDQPSVADQEGPRRLPAEQALPFSSDVSELTAGIVPQNPVPGDPVSLQRGALLYGLHCALCHGAQGKGDGPITKFWNEKDKIAKPANLTDPRMVEQPDGALYLTLTQGFGVMPPLAENLTARERWDVINYVRTLQPARGK